jgi:hypothetical protein
MRQFGSLRRWVGIVVCGSSAVLTAATAVHAQRTSAPDQVTRKVRVRDINADTNISPSPEVNIRDKPSGVAPPAGKGPGGKPQCLVTVDNHTDLITKTYVDGRYSGTVRPFGELAMSIVPGSAQLYARAEYDDGSADAWGPVRVSCRTTYVWRLAD